MSHDPAVIIELKRKLEDLSMLVRGWDSYDARPIYGGAIQRGKHLVATLPNWGWQIVPVADGGVQIESHIDGYDVEIYIRKAD